MQKPKNRHSPPAPLPPQKNSQIEIPGCEEFKAEN